MRMLTLGIGGAGALLVARYAALFWRVISGPGDDNPIGGLFALAALLALWPAAGLLFAAVPPRSQGPLWKFWLAVSVLALALLTPFAGMFLL